MIKVKELSFNKHIYYLIVLIAFLQNCSSENNENSYNLFFENNSIPPKNILAKKLYFVNNPLGLAIKDSVWVLFNDQLVYSGGFNFGIDINLDKNIKEDLFVDFLIKKDGVYSRYSKKESELLKLSINNLDSFHFIFLPSNDGNDKFMVIPNNNGGYLQGQ